MRYDVIVVGAGPAGSTTAREAAARGLSVLLLDKAEFPRDKPCGGGVNVRTQRLLPFPLGDVAERAIHGMRITLRQGHGFNRSYPEPVVHLTQRQRLDTLLVERAVAAGATLRERATVKAIERHAERIVVRVDGEAVEGRALVGADGANGRTARLCGLEGERWLVVALEGNVTLGRGSRRNGRTGSVWTWAAIRAATAGSSRRGTTSTSGLGSGSRSDRACGSGSRG